jgi:hypothetical protein
VQIYEGAPTAHQCQIIWLVQPEFDERFGKLDHRCAEHIEPIGTTEEVAEMWHVEDGVHEKRIKRYLEVVEQRCVDLGDEVFKALASAIKGKVSENGDDNSCRWRRSWWIGPRLMGSESRRSVSSLVNDDRQNEEIPTRKERQSDCPG